MVPHLLTPTLSRDFSLFQKLTQMNECSRCCQLPLPPSISPPQSKLTWCPAPSIFKPWPKASLWPLQPTLSLSMVGQRCQGFTAPLPDGSPQLRTEGLCSIFPGSLAPACRAYTTRAPRVPSRLKLWLPSEVTFSVTRP